MSREQQGGQCSWTGASKGERAGGEAAEVMGPQTLWGRVSHCREFDISTLNHSFSKNTLPFPYRLGPSVTPNPPAWPGQQS